RYPAPGPSRRDRHRRPWSARPRAAARARRTARRRPGPRAPAFRASLPAPGPRRERAESRAPRARRAPGRRLRCRPAWPSFAQRSCRARRSKIPARPRAAYSVASGLGVLGTCRPVVALPALVDRADRAGGPERVAGAQRRGVARAQGLPIALLVGPVGCGREGHLLGRQHRRAVGWEPLAVAGVGT